MTDAPEPTTAAADDGSGRALVRTGTLAGGAIVTAWVVSVLYHVVLFAGMYLLPWLSGIVGRPADEPAPFTDVVGQLEQPVASLTPTESVVPLDQTAQREPLKLKPDSFRSMQSLAPEQKNDLKILGVGTRGGDFDRQGFGLALGGQGPDFFGLGAQARGARRIVYVVDRSGSMVNTFDAVRSELKESIGGLRRTQKFHVILFSSGPPLENPARRLVAAIRSHKRDTFKFLDSITTDGGTDPAVALRRAFAVEPDLIYLLTDGEFNPKIVKTLDKLNRSRSVRIFTIAYVSTVGSAVLERIAREHNGEYKFVSEDEVF